MSQHPDPSGAHEPSPADQARAVWRVLSRGVRAAGDDLRPAKLAPTGLFTSARHAHTRWPRWQRACFVALWAVPLGLGLGVIGPALVAGVAVLAVTWPELSRWRRLLALAGALGLGWLLFGRLAPLLVGLSVFAAWLLTDPTDQEQPETERDPLAVKLFAAVADIIGAPREEDAWTTQTGEDGSQRRVRLTRPSDPARYVRVQRTPDGHLERVAVHTAPHFEPSRRGRLEHQVSEVLRQRVLSDYARGYDRPTFRPVPPMPAGTAVPYTGEHLDGLAWHELAIALTDPDAPLARELLGRPWLVWDIQADPHMLFTGTTGAGKSSALRVLLTVLLRQIGPMLAGQGDGVRDPHTGGLAICDGKGGEFSYLRGRRSVRAIAEDLDTITAVVELVYREMRRRSRLVTETAGRDDPEPLFPPLVLLIDEWMDIIDDLDDATEFLRQVRRIAQRGRSVRVFVIVATQSPYAQSDGHEGLPGPLKRLLNARLGIGPHDTVQSRMTFDDADLGKTIERAKGRGVCKSGADHQRVQFPWLANPRKLAKGTPERDQVEALLPPWKDDAEREHDQEAGWPMDALAGDDTELLEAAAQTAHDLDEDESNDLNSLGARADDISIKPEPDAPTYVRRRGFPAA